MMDFPASPTVGQSFAPGTGTQYVWDGVAWTALNNSSPALITDTPPVNPAVGQLWWRSTTGKLYIYVDDGNSKQWVETGTAGAIPGAWEQIGGEYIVSAQTTYDIKDLAPFKRLRWIGAVAPTAQSAINFRTSSDNGVTWYAGATDYLYQYFQATGATSSTSSAGAPLGYMSNTIDAGTYVAFHAEFENFNVAGGDKGTRCHSKQRGAGALSVSLWGGSISPTAAMNALRLTSTVGTPLTGSFMLEGVRG